MLIVQAYRVGRVHGDGASVYHGEVLGGEWLKRVEGGEKTNGILKTY